MAKLWAAKITTTRMLVITRAGKYSKKRTQSTIIPWCNSAMGRNLLKEGEVHSFPTDSTPLWHKSFLAPCLPQSRAACEWYLFIALLVTWETYFHSVHTLSISSEHGNVLDMGCSCWSCRHLNTRKCRYILVYLFVQPNSYPEWFQVGCLTNIIIPRCNIIKTLGLVLFFRKRTQNFCEMEAAFTHKLVFSPSASHWGEKKRHFS